MNKSFKAVRNIFVSGILMSGIGLFPTETAGDMQDINRQIYTDEKEPLENQEKKSRNMNEIEKKIEEEIKNPQAVLMQEEILQKKILDVPVLCQYPELPTGCESTSAAMILQYYGVHVSPETFASQWLECERVRKLRDGKIHGPDPSKAFAGNPFSYHAYGCYAEVIADAVNKNCRYCMAVVHKERSLDELCKNFVSRGIPVMIWATMGMKPSRQGDKWVLEDGSVFDWIAGEHCLVLSGYTQTHYILNDPQTGNVVFYPKKTVQKRFEELGCQSVVVNKYETIRHMK